MEFLFIFWLISFLVFLFLFLSFLFSTSCFFSSIFLYQFWSISKSRLLSSKNSSPLSSPLYSLKRSKKSKNLKNIAEFKHVILKYWFHPKLILPIIYMTVKKPILMIKNSHSNDSPPQAPWTATPSKGSSILNLINIKETELWTIDPTKPILKAAQVSTLLAAPETNPAIIPYPKLTKFVLS